MSLIVLSISGAFGAVLRYLVSVWAQRAQARFPVGTLLVNSLGCFLLGLTMGSAASVTGPVVAIAGFLGGFTTYSTWMVESAHLGWNLAGLANVTFTLAAGLGGAAVGLLLAA